MAGELHVVQAGIYPHRIDEMVAWTRAAIEAAGYRYTSCRRSPPRGRPGSRVCRRCHRGHRRRWGAKSSRGWSAVVVGQPGVGLDAIDLGAAAELGIAVCNQPESCTDEVADHTLALILSCVRKVPWLNARVKTGIWDRSLFEPMPRLRGKTLGLVALGESAARWRDGRRVRPAHDRLRPLRGSRAGRCCRRRARQSRSAWFARATSCPTWRLRRTRRAAWSASTNRPDEHGAILTSTSRGAVIDERRFSGRSTPVASRPRADVLAHEPADPANPLLPDRMSSSHRMPPAIRMPWFTTCKRLAVEEIVGVFRGGLPTEIAWGEPLVDARGGRIGATRADAGEALPVG